MAPPTYGVISIGHLAPYPSSSGVQWSTEGQALILTKNAVYILVRLFKDSGYGGNLIP